MTRAVFSLLVALGVYSLWHATAALATSLAYSRDFVAIHVSIQALASGVDPYIANLDTLSDALGFPADRILFGHISLYPPTMAAVLWPLSRFDYITASALWWALQVPMTVASAYLLLRQLGHRPSFILTIASGVAAFAWHPFYQNITYGQVFVLILLFLVGARYALLSGHPFLAGLLAGLAVAVKPVTWPLFVYFALTRDWRALAGAVGALAASFALALFMAGPAICSHWLTISLPFGNGWAKAGTTNLSLWTMGWRFFHGTEVTVGNPLATLQEYGVPLIPAETLAPVVSATIPAIVLAGGLWYAWRRCAGPVAFDLLLCVSLLVSPILWGHNFVLLMPALATIESSLVARGSSWLETRLLVALGLLLFVPEEIWWAMAVVGGDGGPGKPIAFLPGLWHIAPTLLVCAIAYLVVRQSRINALQPMATAARTLHPEISQRRT